MKTRILLVAVFASAMLAQGPGGPGRPGGPGAGPGGPGPGAQPIDSIRSYLSLTEAQIRNFATLSAQLRDNTLSLRQQIDGKQGALNDMLQKGSTDTPAMGTLLLDMQSLRKQIDQAFTTFHDQAVNTLTADQKTKLKALEAAQQLQDAVRQAVGLGLLTAPEGGPFVGPGGPGANRLRPGFGFGPGPRPVRRPGTR